MSLSPKDHCFNSDALTLKKYDNVVWCITVSKKETKETNYELKIQSKENPNFLFREFVSITLFLLKNASPNLFKKALVMKEIRVLQKKGYNEKVILNMKIEMAKLKDFEFLKNCIFHVPFNSKKEVTEYMTSEKASENKINRLCHEIRHVKATSLNLPQAFAPIQFMELREVFVNPAVC